MESDLDAVSGLSVSSLKRYMHFNGWSGGRQIGSSLELYVLQDDQQPTIEVLLPREQSGDSPRRLALALRSISQLEGIGISELITKIQSINFDIIKSKLPNHLVRNDTVGLEIASDFISKLKRIMEAAATTELNRQKFFERTRKEAINYAQRCRFGHTFRGSFGFIIESPVDRNDEPTINGVEQEPPFERKIVQRIARGLKTVVLANATNDLSALVRTYESGLNANMAEELADIIDITGGATISFGITLSPEWRSPDDLQPRTEVQIGPAYLDIMREAARKLRQQEIDRNRVVQGRIIRLHAEEDPSDLLHPVGGREVVVKWSSPDLGDINVKVALPPQEYLAAVEAHKNGQAVTMKGLIDKIGRSWELRYTSDFSVLP